VIALAVKQERLEEATLAIIAHRGTCHRRDLIAERRHSSQSRHESRAIVAVSVHDHYRLIVRRHLYRIHTAGVAGQPSQFSGGQVSCEDVDVAGLVWIA
jgi:hypothetical protein